jgi:hypothetical protein
LQAIDPVALRDVKNQYSFSDAKSAAVWGAQLANLRQAYMVSHAAGTPCQQLLRSSTCICAR